MNDKPKIKIVFLMDQFKGFIGGTENQFVKIVSTLDRDTFDVRIVFLKGTDWVDANTDIFQSDVESLNLYKLKNPLTFFQFIKLAKYLKSARADIVITFFPLSNIVGVLAAKLAGVKTIISTRRDFGLWKNWLFKGDVTFLRMANRFVKSIIANSQSVKELTENIEKASGKKIHVIYNGISIGFQKYDNARNLEIKKRYGINDKKIIVGIVASLTPMKKHDTFIKSAEKIVQNRKGVHFLVVGDGFLREKWEKLVSEKDLSEYFTFAGFQDDVRPLLGIIDIGVNCSDMEGLSNAIMEYMIAGIPSVVSRAGGNPELVTDGLNGFLFETGDHHQLADNIEWLIDDEKLRKQFVANSYTKMEHEFTVEKMVKNYEEHFLDLLAIRQ